MLENETTNVGNNGFSKRDTELFYKLVLMLKVGAYEQLGLIDNPYTKEKKRKLRIARETIDMLNMILRRMKLTQLEKDALQDILTELQTLFIKESEIETGQSDDIN